MSKDEHDKIVHLLIRGALQSIDTGRLDGKCEDVIPLEDDIAIIDAIYKGKVRARMQIVIDIPDRIYKIVQNRMLNITDAEILENALKNGTPLPKGHGRLIDADMLWDLYHDNDYDFYEALDDVQTIIEADDAESEE